MDICLIFDLDGTLVDSEYLGNKAFKEVIPEISETVEDLVEQYRGQKLSRIFEDIENGYGIKVPKNIEAEYQERVESLFQKELKATPGVAEMLRSLTCPYCIASSGPLEKIRSELRITKLDEFFKDNVFSSYTIGSWKPEPGLFLHAARAMGFAPEKCLVIEDSESGILAARNANMDYLQYCPQQRVEYEEKNKKFNSMGRLHLIIENVIEYK
jgi:HAD superfamily hydrolase (TIGR01509 family)